MRLPPHQQFPNQQPAFLVSACLLVAPVGREEGHPFLAVTKGAVVGILVFAGLMGVVVVVGWFEGIEGEGKGGGETGGWGG